MARVVVIDGGPAAVVLSQALTYSIPSKTALGRSNTEPRETLRLAGVSWLARVRWVFGLVGGGFRVVGLYYPRSAFWCVSLQVEHFG